LPKQQNGNAKLDIEYIIKYIDSCRQTHVQQVEWFDNGGNIAKWLKSMSTKELEESYGTREFHETCVKDYSRVIAYLDSVKYKLDS
jgi:CTP-dependent riboflavin kinase